MATLCALTGACSLVDERCGMVTAGGAMLAASATGALSSIFVDASRTGKRRMDLCRRVKEHHYDLLQLE